MSGWDQGWQFGSQLAEHRIAEREAARQLTEQRNFDVFKNELDSAPADKHQQMIRDYLAAQNPAHAPSIISRLAGLIHGQKPNPNASSTTLAAPLPKDYPAFPGSAPPVAKDALGVSYETTTPAPGSRPAVDAEPMHPFTTNHPVLSKMNRGLKVLTNHFKAFARPVAPGPMPTPLIEKYAEYYKSPEEAATEARIREIQAKPLSPGTWQMQALNGYASQHGFKNFNSMPFVEQKKAIQELDATHRAPKVLKDPSTGYWSSTTTDDDGNMVSSPILDTNGKPFGGFPPDKITIKDGFYTFKDELTGQITQVPVTSETQQIFAPFVAGGKTPPSPPAPGNPHTPDPPLNAQQILQRGAEIIRRSKGANVIGQTASLLDKSDAAQFTKAADDANNKEKTYNAAKEGMVAPTASSDQELIFAWVRSNVFGAGKMTQAEFKQAGEIGSLPLRAQTAYDKATTGRLAPELEQSLLADIERSARTARDEANQLRSQVGSSRAPVSRNHPKFPVESKGSRSLRTAMGLPINKGKSDSDVRNDLESRGYTVTP